LLTHYREVFPYLVLIRAKEVELEDSNKNMSENTKARDGMESPQPQPRGIILDAKSANDQTAQLRDQRALSSLKTTLKLFSDPASSVTHTAATSKETQVKSDFETLTSAFKTIDDYVVQHRLSSSSLMHRALGSAHALKDIK